MTLSAGTRLGPYVILSPLGAGGMGEVYRARDTRLTRDVAVKVLAEHLSSSPDARQRFDQEAKMVARLSHPHICAIHDVGREGDLDYLVMDCLEGESLAARIRRGPLPIHETLLYGIQIAEALEHAHHAGVVHRDLKPGNVFLTKKSVKVLDFGLARRLPGALTSPSVEAAPDDPTVTARGTGPVTTPGTVAGTLSYMAPEQLLGKEADARTDIFAFGATLYEMVTGRPAFSAATRPELMSAILRDQPKPLTEIVPLAPPALERLVLQCLAKDPDDRWESAHDLTNALQWIRDEISVAGVQKPLAEAQRIRRRAFAFAAVSLVAIALALVVVIGTYRSFKKTPLGTDVLSDPKRIAVLPFEHQGPASEEYFSDGISDEVRRKLVSLPGTEVIGRGSSIGYKKAGKKPEQIAKELSVRYLLMGTVRWENPAGQSGRVHISPELVEVRAKGPSITRWQQDYPASLTDVFEVQAGIASRVAQAMNVVLSPPQQTALAEKPTRNLEAWEAYIRGREIFPPLSDLARGRKAISYYEHAVEVDPKFAQAWAMLSRAHSAVYENAVPSSAEAAASKRAVDKALALAPARPESLLAGGYYQRYVTKDYAKARENFEKAFRLAPGDADVLVALGDLNVSDGRWADSVARFEQARWIDPRSVRVAQRLAKSLLYLRRFQEALAGYEQGLGLAPRNLNLIEEKAIVFLAQGDLPAARSVFDQSARDVDRTELGAAFAYYSDLYWTLSQADQDRILETTPDAFDGDLSVWAIVQAEILWLRGEKEKAGGFARKACSAAEAQLKDSPDNSPRHALLGLAYAYAGRREKAIAEVLEAVRLLPIAKDAERGAYIQLQLVRVYLLVGEPEKALDSLEPLLKIPFYVTPGWLRIDPTFDPLRENPRFQRLL